MKLSLFDYHLPKNLIASTHIEPRDYSRLLVYDRKSGQIEHRRFYEIIDYLNKDDVLVFNDSRVFKARLVGKKKTGGKVELLLVRFHGSMVSLFHGWERERNNHYWETMVKGRVKEGDKIYFEYDLEGELVKRLDNKIWVIKFNKNTKEIFKWLDKYGIIPLPPYIKKACLPAGKARKQENLPRRPAFRPPAGEAGTDRQAGNETMKQPASPAGRWNNLPRRQAGVTMKNFYQTVYAKKIGSVAAPTAGFHFTEKLLRKIKNKGVECLNITLHVGPGTFLPVQEEDIEKHKIHEEYYEIRKTVGDKIIHAKKEGKRIIAVGTTTCRVLENADLRGLNADRHGIIRGKTNLFIYPPFDFKIVDALITNFHLPKSTLLMLVAAFLDPQGTKGISEIKKIYKKAIALSYRFYSFGDGMLIR